MDLLVFSQKFFRKKTCINVDGIEWLRPKWKGLVVFILEFHLTCLQFFDKIITDSKEMKIIYKNRFNKNSSMIAYGPTMIKLNNSKNFRKYLLKQKSYYLIVGRLIPDNNSKLIIDGFIKSKSNKKIVIVGDVPYSDYYSQLVKSLANDRIVFTGYINDNKTLSCLYKYCFGYIHGHEFGGTNPTMINALHFNCPIMALNTVFNKEMTLNKHVVFNKNLKSIIKSFNFLKVITKDIIDINLNYDSSKYNWDIIIKKYESSFMI